MGRRRTRRHGEIAATEGVIRTPISGKQHLSRGALDRAAIGSMFLDGLQVHHDGTDVLTAKSEFRHIWMARDDALAQSFLQELDRVAPGKSAKQWSLRVPALADTADGMTTRAIPFEKRLAAMEGGYVRGSSSGRQEGEIDPQR
jgi:hypothetical protein